MAPAGIGDRLEGIRAVRAALASRRVTVVYLERSRRDAERLADEARRAGARVRLVDSVSGLSMTGSPQGLVARARPVLLAPLDRLLAAQPAGRRVALIVLDHLEDPRNVGAIARSALAAGMTGLVIPRRRAAPLSALAFRAAAGALEQLPVASVSSVPAAARQAASAGVWNVGLDPSSAHSIFGLDLLAEPVALFVGSEGRGLGRMVRERMDLLASIPMAPDVASLNAGVAAALACFEVHRVRGE